MSLESDNYKEFYTTFCVFAKTGVEFDLNNIFSATYNIPFSFIEKTGGVRLLMLR